MDDILISFGGELKSLDNNGKFGGYLVRYSTAKDPDLYGDFFTKSTNYFKENGDTIPILYDHGKNASLKTRQLGRATVKIDDVGLWIEGELNLRDEYEKAINDKLIKAGKAGLSSGAAPHMIQRKSVGNAREITEWGIAEASITPMPVEPRCDAIALKSYMLENADEEDPFKAMWSSKMIGELPDSAFGYVEPGGETKDGITTPLNLRHFPYKGTDGKPDAAHVRNALARIPQSSVSDDAKASALTKIKAAAKELGVDAADDKPTKSADNVDLPINIPAVKADEPRPFKGAFTEELTENTPSFYQYNNALCEVVKDIANASTPEIAEVTGAPVDVHAKITEAVAEYAAALIPMLEGQVNDWIKNPADSDSNYVGPSGNNSFYVRSYLFNGLNEFLSVKGVLVTDATLDEHSAKAVSAVTEYADQSMSFVDGIKSWVKRLGDKIQFRASTKSGRVLSAANMERAKLARAHLGKAIPAMQECHDKLGSMIENASTQAPSEKGVSDAELLQIQWDYTKLETEMALAN